MRKVSSATGRMLGPELALTDTTSQESRVTCQEVVQSTQNLQQKLRLVTGFPPLLGRMDILGNQGLRGVEGTTHQSQVNKGLGCASGQKGKSLPLFLEKSGNECLLKMSQAFTPSPLPSQNLSSTQS